MADPQQQAAPKRSSFFFFSSSTASLDVVPSKDNEPDEDTLLLSPSSSRSTPTAHPDEDALKGSATTATTTATTTRDSWSSFGHSVVLEEKKEADEDLVPPPARPEREVSFSDDKVPPPPPKRPSPRASPSTARKSPPQPRRTTHATNELMRAVVSAFPKPLRQSIFQVDNDRSGGEAGSSESTPLMGNQYGNTVGGGGICLDPRVEKPDPEAPKNPKIEHAWQVLRAKVQSGDLLLRSLSMDSGRRDPGPRIPRTESERFAKRQEAYENIRSGIELNMWHCIATFLLFMAIGIVAFSYLFDHWSLTDAMYFALVTCTTVGYGDLVPDSPLGRIFTCVYALAGVCFLGIALGVLGNSVVEAQEAAVEQTSTVAKKKLVRLFSPPTEAQDGQRKSLQEEIEEDELLAEEIRLEEEAANVQKPRPVWRLTWHLLLVMVLLAIFALAVAQDPGVDVNRNGKGDLLDAFYFAIVTATTVGYGDFSPVTQQGRLLSILFIPLAVCAMGNFLSSVAETIMESRAETVRLQLAQRDLSVDDLEIMDADGDGQVTRAEFLEFMLVAMNKVEKEFVDEMRENFARLDVDGTGTLSKDDLIEQARQKLGRIQRKLELAAYKRHLLQAAAEQRARRQSERSWDQPIAQLRATLLSARRGLSSLNLFDDDSSNSVQSQSRRHRRCRSDADSLSSVSSDTLWRDGSSQFGRGTRHSSRTLLPTVYEVESQAAVSKRPCSD